MNQIESTIIDKMPFLEYQEKEAINRGELVDYIQNKSRWHKKYVLGMFGKEPSDAMQIGSDLHACFLERFPVDSLLDNQLYSKKLNTGANKGELTKEAKDNREMLIGMLKKLRHLFFRKHWEIK
jgi:hypothetical protein